MSCSFENKKPPAETGGEADPKAKGNMTETAEKTTEKQTEFEKWWQCNRSHFDYDAALAGWRACQASLGKEICELVDFQIDSENSRLAVIREEISRIEARQEQLRARLRRLGTEVVS